MGSLPTVGDHLRLTRDGKILVVTLNRPSKLNCVSAALQADLERLLDWYEAEPSLWCLVVTGTGRAFCAGADLSEMAQQAGSAREFSKHGFASLSRRYTTKPFICAVNGLCLGGGLEAISNADIVIASDSAKFGYPEVTRGVTAAQGGIPRTARISGHLLAAELLLTGKIVSAREARDRYGLVNDVVPADDVLPTALDVAKRICDNSPDAVQLTKRSLEEARRVGCGGVEKATVRALDSEPGKAIFEGDNLREGLTAFLEKRKPAWTDPPPYARAKL